MAPGQAKLTFAVSKVFSACNEPWNYCMPSKMAADEKPKEQVPQAETAWKWNLKHKVSFLIWIAVKFQTPNPEKGRELLSKKKKKSEYESGLWQDVWRTAVWPGLARGDLGSEVGAEVGVQQDDDVEVHRCSQNRPTPIRFDLITGPRRSLQTSIKLKRLRRNKSAQANVS